MTKTVWIVNPFDNLPSEGNRPQRYWLMAEAFVRAGHRVVYWTSDFSHATKKKRVVNKPCRSGEVENGIEVIQMPTLPYKKNICLARVRSHRQLAKDFKRLATQALSPCSIRSPRLNNHSSLFTPHSSLLSPDVIIASTPPLGLCLAAMRVARSCGAKFVCDIQDAWPETFERVLPRFVWSLLGMRRAAKWLYCEADGVSAVARRYLELAKAYGSNKPTHLAGHAIDSEELRVESEEFGVKSEKIHNSSLVTHHSSLKLVYAGNMSLSYDLETVIRVVRDLPNVTLDIAGNGPDLERLKALCATLNSSLSTLNSPICFHGYLGEAALSSLLRSCDVGIIPMFPESCVGVPGKLADYAAAGLRVIESLGGECQEILAKYNAGVHYAAGDMNSLKEAIATLCASTPLCLNDSAEKHGNRAAFARYFDARNIMDEYVKWSETMLTKPECSPDWHLPNRNGLRFGIDSEM